MSAEVRYDPVAYCNYCAEASDWHDDAEEWAAEHNRENHPEEGTPDE